MELPPDSSTPPAATTAAVTAATGASAVASSSSSFDDHLKAPLHHLSQAVQDREGAFSRSSAAFCISSFDFCSPADHVSQDEGRLGPYLVQRVAPALPASPPATSPAPPYAALDTQLFCPLLQSASPVLANALMHQRLVFGDSPVELAQSNAAKRWRRERRAQLTQSSQQPRPDQLPALVERALADQHVNSLLTAVLVLSAHGRPIELLSSQLAASASVYAAQKGDGPPPRASVFASPLTFLQLHHLLSSVASPAPLTHLTRVLSCNLWLVKWKKVPLASLGLERALAMPPTTLRGQVASLDLASQLRDTLVRMASLSRSPPDLADEASCCLVVHADVLGVDKLALLTASLSDPSRALLVERLCSAVASTPPFDLALVEPLFPSLAASLSCSWPLPSPPPQPWAEPAKPNVLCLARRLPGPFMGRLHLLRVLQGLLVAAHTNTSPAQDRLFTLDETRLPESIQLSHEGRRATQRGEKRWGTCFSSTPLTDSERIHRWKVNVDRCEEGHVFVGVATKDAACGAYLGEDQFGWGFIGKGHIWHNRDKKGSYGDPVRSGDVISCTLDTKRGTLSFASLTRDFGVAFTGLKDFCSNGNALYPAIALYDKGDSATMFSSGGGLSSHDLAAYSVCGAARWAPCDGLKPLASALALAERACQLIKDGPSDALLAHLDRLFALSSSSALVAQKLLQPMLAFLALWPQALITPRVAAHLYPLLMDLLKQKKLPPPPDAVDFTGSWMLHGPDFASAWQMDIVHDPASGLVSGTMQGWGKISGSAYLQRLVLGDGSRALRLRALPGEAAVVGTVAKPGSSRKRVLGMRLAAASERERPLRAVAATVLGKVCVALVRPHWDEDDASTTWASSELFCGGIEGVEDHVRRRMDAFGPALEALLGPSPSSSRGVEDSDEAEPAPQPPECDEFVTGLARGEAQELDRWMLRFAGQGALAAVGGPAMSRARFHILAALVSHTGLETEATLIDAALREMDEAQSLDPDEQASPHPSRMLVNCWRASLRVMGWAVARKQSEGLNFEVLAEPLVAKAQLLLKTRPALLPALNYDDALPLPQDCQDAIALRLAAFKRDAKAQPGRGLTHAAALERLVSFFTDAKVDLDLLQAQILDKAWTGVLRSAGLTALRKALELRADTAAVAQWVSVGLRDAPCPLTRSIEDEDGRVLQSQPETACVLSLVDYEDMGLVPHRAARPAGARQSQGGRAAFEALAKRLVGMLDEAAGSTDEQLALLDAWGFVLDAKDVGLILDYGLFEALQRLVNLSRRRLEEGELVELEQQAVHRVIDSCLKLLQVLAYQVVQLADRANNDKAQQLSSRVFRIILDELAAAMPPSQQDLLLREDFVYLLLDLLFSMAVSGEDAVRPYLDSEQCVAAILACTRARGSSPRLLHRSMRLLGRLLSRLCSARSPDTVSALLGDLADCITWHARPNEPYANRVFAASELVALLRRLHRHAEWRPLVDRELARWLGKHEDDDDVAKRVACVWILGGLLEPLRVGGCVRVQSLEEGLGRGLVVSTDKGVVKVVVASLQPSEAEEDEALAAQAGRGGRLCVTAVEPGDFAPCSEVLPEPSAGLPCGPLLGLPQPEEDLGRAVLQLQLRVGAARVAMHGGAEAELARLVELACEPTSVGGLADVGAAVRWWLLLGESWFERQRTGAALPPPPAAARPASSAALEQMLGLDLGFTRAMCEAALERCGNNVESAINFCLEHGPELQQPRRSNVLVLLREMGFPPSWCAKALDAVGHEGFDQCLTWILANGDALTAQDERGAEQGLAAAPAPPPRLQCMSGAVTIAPDLSVTVRGSGNDFPSVTAKGIMLTSGCAYYEVTLLSEGCMQIGWVDAAFTGDVHEGNGVGDDAHSWSFDGLRKFKWHETSVPWGGKNWKQGDTVGCAMCLDRGELWFSLNGSYEDGMGLAFRLSRREAVRGLAPAASLHRNEKLCFNFGGPESPPLKFRGPWDRCPSVHEAAFSASNAKRGLPGPEDCTEELVGEALADRFFFEPNARARPVALSPGNAPGHRRAASGAAAEQAWSPGCSLSGSAGTMRAALEEVSALPPGREGDEQLAAGMRAAARTLLGLFARMAVFRATPAALGEVLARRPEFVLPLFKLLPPRPEFELLLDRPLERQHVFECLPGRPAELVQPLARALAGELARAAEREFALVPWDDDSLQPRHIDALAGGADDRALSDAALLALPSVRFAVWATEALVREPSARDMLVAPWAMALRSPGVRLKTVAARMLTLLCAEGSRDEVRAALDVPRVQALALSLVARGGLSVRAAHSRFAMSLAELVGSLLDDDDDMEGAGGDDCC